ncbi:Non-heme chloroperoxidase [Fusarium oxysporum f. sp. albedinis]|nr:Uncharacterized protein HZ326_20584 [Fusarium oxysporum f. sp. albedinis]KAJ0136462.1 Non-heme chloroperoxidase [Fusarium oxysporum f. sp. albedinis]
MEILWMVVLGSWGRLHVFHNLATIRSKWAATLVQRKLTLRTNRIILDKGPRVFNEQIILHQSQETPLSCVWSIELELYDDVLRDEV